MFKYLAILLIVIPFVLSAQFTIYTPDNSGITDNFVDDIVVDLDNRVWMASFSNVIMVENDNWNFYNSNNSKLPEQAARRIYLDDKGVIWILFENAIAKYQDDEFIIVDNEMGGYTFAIDYDQNIWLSRNEELWVKRDGNWEKALKKGIEPELAIFEIIVDKNNEIWFDRPEFGFRKVVEDSSRLILNPELPLKDQDYLRIRLDSNNNIWASSDGDIAEYNPKKDIWKSYKSQLKLVPNGMNEYISFAFDENNYCFIGANTGFREFEGGIDVYLNSLYNGIFNSYFVEYYDKTINKNIRLKGTRSLAADFDGNIWFSALYEGVGKFDRKLLSIKLLSSVDYSIYPNPTTDKLNIELENEALATSYKITDTKGKQVLAGNLSPSNSVSIDVEQLSSGVYIVELTTSSGEIVIDKFVKE